MVEMECFHNKDQDDIRDQDLCNVFLDLPLHDHQLLFLLRLLLLLCLQLCVSLLCSVVIFISQIQLDMLVLGQVL